MRVRLTQIIDYWFGIPMAALFSLLHSLHSLFGNSAAIAPKPKKILFIEISEMGSAIIAYSSLKRAKDLIGSDEIYFLVFEKNRESVELLGLIPPEHIITIPDASFLSFAIGAFRALLQVRALRIDTVIDLELFSRFTALFSYASGAQNRLGFHNYTAEGLYRGTFLTHRIFYNPHQHMAKNFLALVMALEQEEKEEPLLKSNVCRAIIPLPQYPVSQEAREHAIKQLKSQCPELSDSARFVVFNPDPGEALPIRGWPMEYFVELAKNLVNRDPKIVIVVIGLQRSKIYADEISRALPSGSCIDLCGKTETLAEVVSLFSISELLVGNDSGPAHFAALTKIGILTLFGPETPALYGPLSDRADNVFAGFSCSPCLSAHNHRYTICKNNRCLKSITPQEVTERAINLLARSSSKAAIMGNA